MPPARLLATALLLLASIARADPPKVLPVDTIGSPAGRYALLDEPQPHGIVRWHAVGPQGCHGGTSVGYPAPDGWIDAKPDALPPPVPGPSLTLVGPSGSRIVRAPRHVTITGPLGSSLNDTSALAVEAPWQDDYRVAIVGEVGEVGWSSSTAVKPTAAAQAANRAWLAKHGIAKPREIYPVRIDKTDLEVLFVYPAEGAAISFVRRGAALIAREVGEPLGMIAGKQLGRSQAAAAQSARWVLVRSASRVRAIEIPAR